MDWKDRLKGLMLETTLRGSTRTTVDPRTGIKPFDGVGSMRLTPPKPDPAVDRALIRIHQKNNPKPRKP